MKNLEFKAELRDPNLARLICKQIKASKIVKLRQTDVYYNVARGRLKKRTSIAIDRAVGSPEPIEYIFYERENRTDAKVSQYHIYTHAQVQERFGQAPLPEWLTVEKNRELYLYNSVRIHIDDVMDLGWYFEYEILIDDNTDMEQANELAKSLKATFLPALGEPIATSYSDLLAQLQGLVEDQKS
ncbi:MAG: CYTH domain-containing protein [Phycisphaerales bacterium]|nr:CYTH domain-containing protein [Phycisphaerales bacterium]